MRKRIWIPEWLYNGLPWGALIVGSAGVWASGTSFSWWAVSALSTFYGAWVLAVRVCWRGGYHG